MVEWIRTRSRRDLILAVLVAGGFFFGASMLFTRGLQERHVVRRVIEHRVSAEYSNAGGVAFDQSFDVGSEGRLEVRMADVDVAVSTGSGSEAHVMLRMDGEDVSARQVLEDLGFDVEQSDGVLSIRAESRDGWDWKGHDLDLSLQVTVPEHFDISVWTGDGDVAIESFEGEVNLQTGDGDIAVERVSGPALRIQTGDGDIAVAGADSREVHIQTGDGDVAAFAISADEIQVRTGDGDIHLENLSGTLRAATGDGDVIVYIDRFDGIEIRTGDGDVSIYAPAGIGADLKLSGGDFVIGEAFGLPVKSDRRRLEGLLNGGGPELSVRVGDGTIHLIER